MVRRHSKYRGQKSTVVHGQKSGQWTAQWSARSAAVIGRHNSPRADQGTVSSTMVSGQHRGVSGKKRGQWAVLGEWESTGVGRKVVIE